MVRFYIEYAEKSCFSNYKRELRITQACSNTQRKRFWKLSLRERLEHFILVTLKKRRQRKDFVEIPKYLNKLTSCFIFKMQTEPRTNN